MPLVIANRVKEFTTTQGTEQNVALSGATLAHGAFSGKLSVNDTCYYTIEEGDSYEIGIGTLVSSSIFQRTTVIERYENDVLVEGDTGRITLKGNAVVYITNPVEYFDTLATDAELAAEVATLEAADTALQANIDLKFDKVGGTVNGDVVIEGNATVNGDLVTQSSNDVNIGDSIITLLADLDAGSPPTTNAGFEINRGNQPTKSFLWIESTDNWQIDDALDVLGNLDVAGRVHIESGSAGAITPDTANDELLIEGAAASGVTIFTPDAFTSTYALGSPSDANGANVQWNYAAGLMTVGTRSVDADVRIDTSNGIQTIWLDGATQNAGIGATPLARLHVETDSGELLRIARTGVADLRVFATTAESDALVYLSGDGGTSKLQFREDGTLTWRDGGNVGIGFASPTATLDINGDLRVANGSEERFTVSTSGVVAWNPAGINGSLTWDTGRAIVKSGNTYDLALQAGATEFLRGYVNGTAEFFDQVSIAGQVNLGDTDLLRTVDNSTLRIGSSTGTGVGANAVMYGGSHATRAGDWELRSDTDPWLSWDKSNTRAFLAGDLEVGTGTAGQLRLVNSGATTAGEWWAQVRDDGDFEIRDNLAGRNALSISKADGAGTYNYDFNVVGETTLSDKLTIRSDGTWFDMSRAGTESGNFGVFKKVDGTTPLGYIGGGGGAALSAGSTADDLALRAEGDFYLASGGNFATLVLDSSQNATFAGDVNISKTGSAAELRVFASGFDAYTSYGDNVDNWSVGIDQSDDSAFKISGASAVGIDDKLRIDRTTGAATFSGQVTATGTVYAAGFMFENDTDTGMTRPAANTIRLEAAVNFFDLSTFYMELDAITQIRRNDTDSSLEIRGGTAGNGLGIELFGGSHATQADDFEMTQDATVIFNYDASADTGTGEFNFEKKVNLNGGVSFSGTFTLGATNYRDVDDSSLRIGGGSDAAKGSSLLLYGDDNGTLSNEIVLYGPSTQEVLRYDASATQLQLKGNDDILVAPTSTNRRLTFGYDTGSNRLYGLHWAGTKDWEFHRKNDNIELVHETHGVIYSVADSDGKTTYNEAAEFETTTFHNLIQLDVLTAEPTAADGMVAYADGTTWDPGAGEGIYGRVNGSWNKMA